MFTTKSKLLGFFILIVLLFITACNEDPIAPQEEHVKAVGMVFFSSGKEIARTNAGETSSKFTVPVGGLTEHIDVKFISEDGTIFSVEEDAPQTLDWEFDNPAVADIWQHEGEEGSFEIHFQGLMIGETNVEFFVMHNDHSDFRSGKIPVEVINQDSTYGTPVGLEISDEVSGSKLVSITDSTVIGQLSISNADTTNHLEVNFFDSYNRYFQPTSPPHSLQIDVADSSIIEISGIEIGEPWAFKIIGLKNGSTTISLSILHDGNVGVSFVPITVNVN